MESCLRYPGKVAVVTGGTQGIGLAIVREFVRQGANVVFCSKGSEAKKGQAIQRELEASECPGEAYFQVCDVRNESDIKRLILTTVLRYGCLDCLVNNAGTGNMETIDDANAQDFRNLMELNAVSCFLGAKYALPYLRKAKGNIINISSMGGVFGIKHAVSYCASKGAVIAMTKALAIDESEYGVRVNSISPGYIETPLLESHLRQSPNPDATMEEIKSNQLLGRVGTAEELASAVLYLAADGTFCTGLNLLVSGGAEVGFGEKNQVEPESDQSGGVKSEGSSSKQ